jgi:hypothetical protein
MTQIEFRTQLAGKASYWVVADDVWVGEVVLNDDSVWTCRIGHSIKVELGRLADREAAAEKLLEAKKRYRTHELTEGTVVELIEGLRAAEVPGTARLVYTSHDGDMAFEWLEPES